LTVAGLLVGCGGRLEDARFPTGSQSIVSSTDYEAVYTVDPDAGTVVRIDARTGRVRTIDVGGEPTRLARANGRVFATLRAERAIAVLDEIDGDLELSHTVSVGAEPFGIVASEDGTRLYVAESTQGRVSELDGTTLERLASWDVSGEPRWLALHPSGKSLFVGTAFGDGLVRIDLVQDEVIELGLPVVTGMHRETFNEIELTGRVTGDLAISPDGRVAAVPVLYVDNISPVSAPSVDADGNSVVNGDEDEFFEDEFMGGDDSYGGGGSPRFNPGVVLIPLDPRGVPVEDDIIVVNVGGIDDDFIARTSYPASVVFSPDGETVLASLEGANVVVGVTMKTPLKPLGPSTAEPMMDVGFFLGANSMLTRDSRTAITDAGPRGVTFLSKTDARVHSFLDRTVATLDGAALHPNRGDLVFEAGYATGGVEFAEESLPPDLALGRRLFYSANDAQMAALGAAVSCATCHLDVRNDGLTWTFDGDVKRQTPSLAGVVSLTAPLTWTDNVATVTDEVVLTSQGRMGGSGLNRSDAERVAAFIDSTREVDVPLADSTSDSVTRGAALFASEDVGCQGCHSGIAYTDNEAYDMYGLDGVQTRSLVGIAASAPYFHDGSSATLRAVIERVRDGSMGDTSMLSDTDKDDLEAFLRSL
jgi:mono/diheme cytochrome c family protein